MNGKTHLSVGMAIGAAMGAEYFKHTGEPVGVVVMVVSSAVGSVLPDIDLETSYIGCRIPILSKFINRVFGHRGFTHSILCMVCCGLLLRIVPWYPEMILFSFCAGYLSHLILDMLNPVGVPLFYPYKKKFRIAWISSGSPIQWVISAGAILVAAAAWLIP